MVILLDKHKRPLGFTSEKHARKMMGQRRACIYRRSPFIIIAKDLDARKFDGIRTYRIKIDPGSETAGISIIGNEGNKVYFYMQIEHHASEVKKNLSARSDSRRNRRERETWYRKPKWGNKPVGKDGHKVYGSPRPEGWLPPSVKSIGDNIITWVKRFKKWLPITECSFEAVRFDTQLLDNPDIEGEEYQHGTLFGYELKEYLLEKYQHTCQYCNGESGDPVLEWEHKVPKSRGGSDSMKNAALSCKCCNQLKNNRTPEEWLADIQAEKNPSSLGKVRAEGIQNVIDGKQTGGSNRYCAWANSTRRYVEKALFSLFGDVECASGGRTKKNRRFQGRTNACGIIITKYKDQSKRRYGLQCGDYVELTVQQGKNKGMHCGILASVRSDGRVVLQTEDGTKYNGTHKYCKVKQRSDGYSYRVAVPQTT